MATPYDEIYNVFLGKVTDTELVDFLETDRILILRSLMDSACTQFKTCRKDLSNRNEDDDSFVEDLSRDVVEIISELMLVEWIKPKLYLTENFKNVMNTKDFNQFSNANLLKETRETYQNARKHAKSLMVDYSYRDD